MVNMQLHGTTLTCSECGQEFTVTAGAAGAQLSSSRGGPSKPTRCAFCRAASMIAGDARVLRESSAEPRGQSGHLIRSASSLREMYPAVCHQCGKQTKVPFEPRAYRRVYCPACYQAQHRTSSGRDDGVRSRP